VLVEGDAFFGFLATDAVEPWLPESNEQNRVVTKAAASAAGTVASGGYTTVFDGIVGPWFLPTFATATGLDRLDYVILLPSAETCVHRVRTRHDHGFADESATRKMHAEFANAAIPERHVIIDPPDAVDDVVSAVESARANGDLTYECR